MTHKIKNRPLILGSTSPYRRELLNRLGIAFDCIAPQVDETPLPHESPQMLAQRLALAKASAVSNLQPDAIVIGSDQVAELEGSPINKPQTHTKAVEQLQRMQGKTVVFHTAVAVTCKTSQLIITDSAAVTVLFRNLSTEEIERYLLTEKPYDCAGSAKIEGLGISLMASVQSDDPTALIGLPLIRTCELLRQAGIQIP